MEKNIRLIDTPGLGGGVKKNENEQIIDKIKKKIQSSIPSLNLILYVFKCTDTRVTKEAEYVMTQITSLFAKDFATNILFILTFADRGEPSVISGLENSFPELIVNLKKNFIAWLY